MDKQNASHFIRKKKGVVFTLGVRLIIVGEMHDMKMNQIAMNLFVQMEERAVKNLLFEWGERDGN